MFGTKKSSPLERAVAARGREGERKDSEAPMEATEDAVFVLGEVLALSHSAHGT